jgi:hypothetical protein
LPAPCCYLDRLQWRRIFIGASAFDWNSCGKLHAERHRHFAGCQPHGQPYPDGKLD